MTDEQRMRFLQGAHFAAALIQAGHGAEEINARFAELSVAWGLTDEQFRASIGEMVDDVLTAERRASLH